MKYCVLRAAGPPWGDYGRILTHGMSAHRQRLGGIIQLERSGPFIPLITFPASDVVVTDSFRGELERSGLSGASFQRIDKAHIVRIDWELWDRSLQMPPRVPPSAAREDYVLAAPHDPSAALQLGALWEILASVNGSGRRDRGSPKQSPKTSLLLESRDTPDFFRVKGPRYLFVTERARQWLETTAADWVAFEECEATYA